MATLLTMVNDLRVLLREEQVGAITETDDLTQALISVINKASTTVLESRTWSFDKRTDGVAMFLPALTGTDLYTTLAATYAWVDYSTAYLPWSAYGIFRFRVTSDSVRPELTYRVISSEKDTASHFPLTLLKLNLDYIYSGYQFYSTTDATWKLFSVDEVLPATVRKVLSVRDEIREMQLYFSERDIFEDRVEPRVIDSAGPPETVMVGGTGTNTYAADLGHTSGDTGLVMSVRPIPDVQTPLYYSYVYRHPEMTAATDTLAGVPESVVNLIVDQAFLFCLTSNIEADPVRASQVAKQLRIDIAKTTMEDRVSPNRRRVMRPNAGWMARHPNSRWLTREVPTP